ncbi:response regulator [Dongia deserti]|uniref:response regulator n=1 Tax=Dongia deserti TaxID=2268030 RepID=UPI000E64DF7E|nr:response regulator [Dongia deserti]
MNANEPVNILLVDDQPAKLLSYEVILRDLGENLIKASSGREALEQILKKDIAVVLIDVVMPDLNGFELASMIRDHPRFHTLSIIFVSAISVTELDRLKGYQHGAVDYISVPVVPDLLRAKVKIFAELYRKTRQLERLNAELERRVQERTAALAEANLKLEQRVEERTREREAALAQVHEMQKMESLGQLTGGLAHDFNNLLMGIIGSLDYLAKQSFSDPKAKHFLTAARESAERGAALTKRLLAFARRQELKPEAVDVRRLTEGMAEMLQRSIGPTIQIEMDFDQGLALISVDPNQLELAILNLALNARDAMPDGGRLRISAQSETGATGLRSLEPGDYVRMTVTDTGTGMDEAILKRCSEPFFTTKEVGRGTGLGLSTVHGLAVQSGGGMRISSQQGEGTMVELWFPVAAGVAHIVGAEAVQAPNSTMPRYRVLVVDDEPLVALLTASMLEDLGHESQVVPSGASALRVLRSDGSIDAVITDYAMPDMTGAELATHIRRLRPDLPIILATGYADFPNSNAQDLPRLSKPFGSHELRSILTALQQRPLAS